MQQKKRKSIGMNTLQKQNNHTKNNETTHWIYTMGISLMYVQTMFDCRSCIMYYLNGWFFKLPFEWKERIIVKGTSEISFVVVMFRGS